VLQVDLSTTLWRAMRAHKNQMNEIGLIYICTHTMYQQTTTNNKQQQTNKQTNNKQQTTTIPKRDRPGGQPGVVLAGDSWEFEEIRVRFLCVFGLAGMKVKRLDRSRWHEGDAVGKSEVNDLTWNLPTSLNSCFKEITMARSKAEEKKMKPRENQAGRVEFVHYPLFFVGRSNVKRISHERNFCLVVQATEDNQELGRGFCLHSEV